MHTFKLVRNLSDTSQSGLFCWIDKHYWSKLTGVPLSHSCFCTNCILALTVQKMSGALEILHSNGDAKKKNHSNNMSVHYMLPRTQFYSINSKTSVNDPLIWFLCYKLLLLVDTGIDFITQPPVWSYWNVMNLFLFFVLILYRQLFSVKQRQQHTHGIYS